MSRVYVAIGGNIGEVVENLARAVQAVDSLVDTRVLRISPLFRTAPVGGPEGQPDFLNGAIEVETGLEPYAMMGALLDVERALGRMRGEVNGPRTVDLDILLWEGRVEENHSLSLPHPRMHQRAFVLAPLARIAPEAVHPVSGKTVARLLDELDPAELDDCRIAKEIHFVPLGVYHGEALKEAELC